MKNAIVTGGTSGIGLGVAKMLLGKGYRVYATYYNNLNLPQLSNYYVAKIDQRERCDTYKFIDYIRSRVQHIDCIICNAGVTIRKPFQEFNDEDWNSMFEVALNSHYILIRELFPIIPPESRIIFTGSQMGITPHATVLAYGVCKSAVHALCKNLVKEFEGTGTTINTIVPGFVETSWQKEKPVDIKKNIYDKTAIHRFGSIDEIVGAYKFCIENSFINGSLIEVNGGYNYK